MAESTYDWLVEIYEPDSGRILGRIWTSRLDWNRCLVFERMPVTWMMRRLAP